VNMALSPRTEGDAHAHTHATSCRDRGGCMMCCRCWCHGVRAHLDGTLRPDAADIPLPQYLRVDTRAREDL